MSQYAPDWSSCSMGDAAFAPLGYGGGGDDGLIELLWCNGHVVMQSQAAPQKPPTATRPDHKPDDEAAAAAASVWFQYPAVEDPLERDLFAELFGDTTAPREDEADQKLGDNKCAAAARHTRLMPPPPRPAAEEKDASAEDAVGVAATEGGDSSALTVGSSFCGSNHVQPPAPRAAACAPPPRAGGAGKAAAARDAATVTSSSMRPRSCTTRSGLQPGKRKQSDAAEEDAEFESAADVACEPPQKLTTAKRRRAAEVHNLSERRRRDRINEKMKALQDLIPHCNKTDKASMLDEAIEYLKSLQLQLQMMWMGGGMAAAAPAVVFQAAGVHPQYMQPMVAPPPHLAHAASMPPRMPFMAPPAVQAAPSPVPDPYARYLAVDHLQPPPAAMHYLQGMGAFYPPQIPALLPPPPAAVPGGPAATARTSPSDGILHKKYESCGKSDLQGMTS